MMERQRVAYLWFRFGFIGIGFHRWGWQPLVICYDRSLWFWPRNWGIELERELAD